MGHSFSASYFATHHSDGSYRLYELSSLEQLHEWVCSEGLDGFNVTLPFKTEIMAHLDTVDEEARLIGAVNCVEVTRCDGRLSLIGHNTDWQAFDETIEEPLHLSGLCRADNSKALILGTGGAARAVTYALQRRGIAYHTVSRQPERHSDLAAVDMRQALEMTSDHLIIVNATPVGMHPNTEATPMHELGAIGPQHLCYDLIYNPSPTRWLEACHRRGATICDGLAMLYRQAELSHDIWTGTKNIFQRQ